MEQRENAPYIFISYARKDGKDFAKNLKESLEAFGYKVFLDLSEIKPGDHWPTTVQEALDETTHLILVLTPESNKSKYVIDEVTNFKHKGKPVIPVFFKNVEQINFVFENMQYVDFREEESYEQSFQSLVRNIGNIEERDDWWKTRPFIKLNIHKSNPHCIKKTALISEAHNKMDYADFKIRHLVVTENGASGSKLLGLLSLRQIRKYEQRKAVEQEKAVGEPLGKLVDNIMSKFDPDDPIRNGPSKPKFNYLTTNDTVETLLNQFLEEMTKAEGAGHTFYMSALPIIDDKNNAVGIISFKDICSAICTKPQDLPIPSTTLLKDIMKKPLTATPEETISEVKAGLIDIGQRDAFIVDANGRLMGMIPDHIMIKYEVSEPNRKAKDSLVPVGRLHLKSPDTTVLEMLTEYTQINREYFYSPIVDGSKPPKLLGAVSYIEVFRALVK